MTVKELIERLKDCPQDYDVTIVSRDYWDESYLVHTEEIKIYNNIECIELRGI